jgi:hypothetical protein
VVQIEDRLLISLPLISPLFTTKRSFTYSDFQRNLSSLSANCGTDSTHKLAAASAAQAFQAAALVRLADRGGVERKARQAALVKSIDNSGNSCNMREGQNGFTHLGHV